MKKGITICIGVAIVVIAIFVGIASIPDEVLIESPSFETSENQPTTETPTAEEPTAEEPTAETSESEDDNVIKVEIQDGVGSGDR